MNLLEVFNPEQAPYRDEKSDNSAYRIDDTRKRSTKLTLAKLNKLRQINDVRKLEHEQKLDKVSKQYAPPQEAGGAAGGLGL